MADEKLFGHDGRGNYYGVALVEVPDGTKIPFDDILVKGDKISSQNIDGTDYGTGFLELEDSSKALNYIGIDPDDLGVAGPAGPRGPEGPMGPVGPAGLNWRSSYDSTITYQKDDAVGYSGASYFCLKEVTGIAPLPENDSWALLASQGARGAPGLDGKDGKDGTDGKDAVFDLSKLTQEELKALSQSLYKANQLKWINKVALGMPYNTSNTAVFRIADTNLKIKFTPTGTSSVKIDLARFSADSPSKYDIKRSTQYDGGIEGATFSDTTFTDSWTNIDATTYTGMRESDWLSIFERSTQTWWRCYINIAGTWSTNDSGVYILVETVKMQES